MNKEQLQQQIEDMKNKLVEMEAELNKPEVTINYWQPKEDENMYFVNYLGIVSNSCYSKNYQFEYRVFKTEEEAKRYAEYIKAEKKLEILKNRYDVQTYLAQGISIAREALFSE